MNLKGARSAVVIAVLAAFGGTSAASAGIFWANTYNNSVGAANLGPTQATQVNQSLIGGLDGPQGLVAGANNYIYWADASKNLISRAYLSYDKQHKLHVVVNHYFIRGADNPQGVAVYGGYIYWVNDDTTGSIGRAKLDGTHVNEHFVTSPNTSNGASNDINYATGIAVTAQYIYWADSNQGSIARASTATGGGAEQFITGLSDPHGVAVSGPYIYWTDDQDNGTIGRANLDGSHANSYFIVGAHSPCGVTVSGSYVYWTNAGYGSSANTLGRAPLGGKGAIEDYITGVSAPCGVAVNSFALPSTTAPA